MKDSSDTKYDDQELSVHHPTDNYETGTRFDPMQEERNAAPSRSVNVSRVRSTIITEVGLFRQYPTENNPTLPLPVSENTTVNKALTDKGTARAKKIMIPPLEGIKVRCLNGPYSPANAILLIIPVLSAASVSAREAFRAVYTIFQSMMPDLTYQPNRKDLRCRGYFTHDFDTCTFNAQIWRVHPSFAETDEPDEHIFELRRTSYGGRDSYDELLRAVAVGLMQVGYAKKYANGLQINPKLSIDNDDLGYSGSLRAKYPIELDTECVSRLTALIAKRSYPQHSETLRLLAQCSSGSRKNCEVLMENDELREAVHKELRDGSEASGCLNALRLIELGATAPKKALPSVARSMLMYCAKKPLGYKGMRSQAIENAALGAMNVLIPMMQKKEREEAIRTIEKVLFGKVHEKLFRKVQAICSRNALISLKH